ncbi:hypothetical protein CHI14_21710 [Paenibacillus sp. 7516]|nr:hypothetical protein CHI14_21710 [Paenibacillus sp. 7516]
MYWDPYPVLYTGLNKPFIKNIEIQAIYEYRITWCQINHPWADIILNENLSHFTLCNMNRPILKTVCIM